MKNNYYQVGGSISGPNSIYIKRKADRELYCKLIEGNFCSVFNSRQMGKSSLLVRMKRLLETEAGYKCVTLDLSKIGSKNIREDQWYAGIVYEISKNLGFNYDGFIKRCREKGIGCSHMLSTLIEELASHIDRHKKLIFLIDEVDSVERLPFNADDFFHIIRSVYNRRGVDENLVKVVFSFFGVSSADNLVSDKSSSPFNIGYSIELTGFTCDEIYGLGRGLDSDSFEPKAILDAIAYWTNGQPFLTQKLCLLAAEERGLTTAKILSEDRFVEFLVFEHIVDSWEEKDSPEHFKTIKDRLLVDDSWKVQILRLYRRLLIREKIHVSEISKASYQRLFLSGLVDTHLGSLRIRNRIYSLIFNLEWVDKQLEAVSPYERQMKEWYLSGEKDDNLLLGGDDLERVNAWASRRHLAEEDYRFIGKSQEADKKRISHLYIALKEEVAKRKATEKELKHLMGELESAKSLADEANEAKNLFLSRVEHELKAPVNSILGFGYLAGAREDNSRYIRKINRSARVLKDLISDITDFTDLQKKDVIQKDVIFFIEDIIDKLIGVIAVECCSRQIKLHLNLGDEVYPAFLGDPFRLQQVLLNIYTILVNYELEGDLYFELTSKLASHNEVILGFRCYFIKGINNSDGVGESVVAGDTLRVTLTKRNAELLGASGFLEKKSERSHELSFNLKLKFKSGYDISPSPHLSKFKIGVLTQDDEAFNSLSHLYSKRDPSIHRCKLDTILSFDGEVVIVDEAEINSELLQGLKSTGLSKKVILLKDLYRSGEIDLACANEFETLELPSTPKKILNTISKSLYSLKQAQVSINELKLKGDEPDPVLIVDDDELSREILKALVGELRLPIEMASDGLQALNKLRNKRFSLVFLDIEMPKLSGIDVVKKAHGFDSPLPAFIAVTSRSSFEDKALFTSIGIQGCLAKPFEPTDVINVLKSHFNINKEDLIMSESTWKVMDKFSHMKHIDAKKGLKVCMGKETLYSRILFKFKTTQKHFVELYKTSIEKNPNATEDLILMAHTLKGLASNIGAFDLVDVASELECLLRRKAKEEAMRLLPVLQQRMEDVIKEINIYEVKAQKYTPPDELAPLPENLSIHLRELLVNHDVEAKQSFLENEQYLQNNLNYSDFTNLKNFVDSYSFDQALRLFDHVSDELDSCKGV